MSDGALALITGVRARRAAPAAAACRPASHSLPSQLVVTVTGFQLYKDANELYFSFEFVQTRQSIVDALTPRLAQLPALRRHGPAHLQQVPRLRLYEEGARRQVRLRHGWWACQR